MSERKFHVAVVYDFDGTLGRGGFREMTPILGGKVDGKTFWERVDGNGGGGYADPALMYMRTMMEVAAEEDLKVTAEMFVDHGRELPLYDGLADGSRFERVDACAEELELDVGHYAVSSGNREMIEDCAIGKSLRRIFASRLMYADGVASWPAVAVNDGRRGDCLLRIIAGIEPESDVRVKRFALCAPRRSWTIVLGGRESDFEWMEWLKARATRTVMVYAEDGESEVREKEVGSIAERWVDAALPADHGAGRPLDIFVGGALGRMEKDMYRVPF